MKSIFIALSLSALSSVPTAACNDPADGFASLNGGTAGGAAGEEVTAWKLM